MSLTTDDTLLSIIFCSLKYIENIECLGWTNFWTALSATEVIYTHIIGNTHGPLKEFAFVGRTVNVAARTQELTRTFATDIILTERLYRTIDPAFQVTPLPDTPVKGVDQPLAIYALDGARVTTP